MATIFSVIEIPSPKSFVQTLRYNTFADELRTSIIYTNLSAKRVLPKVIIMMPLFEIAMAFISSNNFDMRNGSSRKL